MKDKRSALKALQLAEERLREVEHLYEALLTALANESSEDASRLRGYLETGLAAYRNEAARLKDEAKAQFAHFKQ